MGYSEDFAENLLDNDIEISSVEIQKYLDRQMYNIVPNLSEKREIVRRLLKFADKYFDGEVSQMINMLKQVQLYHDWCDITKYYQPVDWSSVVNALQKLEEFVSSTEDCITLSGFAGTGKTSILKEFIGYLDDEELSYILAAPTHRAKLVLEALTDAKKTYTLHQLLSLSPNIEIFELDYRDLLFKVEEAFNNKNTAIPYKGIAIIDEASMINDDLFDLLLKKCKEFKCKIVFSGDSQQLRPVKSDHISKVFTLDNKITLTKIYRQKKDNPVSNVLETLRYNSLSSADFETEIGTDNSFVVCNTPNQFLNHAVPYFKDMLSNGNVLECKMLAYTNARVNSLNKAIRQFILGENNTEEFNKGEILVGTDNFDFAVFKY